MIEEGKRFRKQFFHIYMIFKLTNPR